MDYSHYSVKDLIQDEFFQEWIIRPDVDSNSFWDHWLKTHPEKKACIEEAKSVVRNLTFPFYELTENEIEELWRRIKN